MREVAVTVESQSIFPNDGFDLPLMISRTLRAIVSDFTREVSNSAIFSYLYSLRHTEAINPINSASKFSRILRPLSTPARRIFF